VWSEVVAGGVGVGYGWIRWRMGWYGTVVFGGVRGLLVGGQGVLG